MKNTFELVDNYEVTLLEEMGTFSFLQAIIRALDYDTKKDIYEYIARCHDIDLGGDEE